MSEVETTWALDPEIETSYKLPSVVDLENHATEVLIESLLDWISFDNVTQTLKFAPGL